MAAKQKSNDTNKNKESKATTIILRSLGIHGIVGIVAITAILYIGSKKPVAQEPTPTPIPTIVLGFKTSTLCSGFWSGITDFPVVYTETLPIKTYHDGVKGVTFTGTSYIPIDTGKGYYPISNSVYPKSSFSYDLPSQCGDTTESGVYTLELNSGP